EALAFLDFALGLPLQRDVARDAAITAEAAVGVDDRRAAHGDDARLRTHVVAGQDDVAERFARGDRGIVHALRFFIGRAGLDIPVGTADDVFASQPVLFDRAAGDLREAQILVLLPIPVGRQRREMLEALDAFSELRRDFLALLGEAAHEQSSERR